MPNLVYNFQFPANVAGDAATVIDTVTGAEVSGSPVTLDATGLGSLTLPQADTYLGSVTLGSQRVNGEVDLAASIAAGGGGGGSLDGPGAWFNLSTGPLASDGTSQPLTPAEITDTNLPSRADLVTITGAGATLTVHRDGEYQFAVNAATTNNTAGETDIVSAFGSFVFTLNEDSEPIQLGGSSAILPSALNPNGPNWPSAPLSVSAPVVLHAGDVITPTSVVQAWDADDNQVTDGTFSTSGRIGFTRLGDIPA